MHHWRVPVAPKTNCMRKGKNANYSNKEHIAAAVNSVEVIQQEPDRGCGHRPYTANRAVIKIFPQEGGKFFATVSNVG